MLVARRAVKIRSLSVDGAEALLHREMELEHGRLGTRQGSAVRSDACREVSVVSVQNGEGLADLRVCGGVTAGSAWYAGNG